MRAIQTPTCRYLLPFGDEILDYYHPVGESRTCVDYGSFVEFTVESGGICDLIIHEIGGKKFVYEGEIPRIPGILVESVEYDLVLVFDHRTAPFISTSPSQYQRSSCICARCSLAADSSVTCKPSTEKLSKRQILDSRVSALLTEGGAERLELARP
jgi:hypothetical protein